MRVGIDLGTATIRVAEEKKGVILREPSVIADHETVELAFRAGREASRMLGRCPAHLQTLRPVRRGVVGAPVATRELVRQVISRALGWRLKLRPAAAVAVPVKATEFERQALQDAFAQLGLGKVTLVEKPLAAALGADVAVGRPQAMMVLDVGAGVTEIAAISPGIVLSDSIPVGGDALDEALLVYLREAHGLEVSPDCAEAVKLAIGSAHPASDGSELQVGGRELACGLPHQVTVRSAEIREAMAQPLNRLATLLQATLDGTPPSLSTDILERGVVLTGGGAELRGLDRFLSERVGLPVKRAEHPADCVAVGALRHREGRG